MLQYLITDRHRAGGTEAMLALLAQADVDYIQLREKDLSPRQLLAVIHAIQTKGARILINDRADLALASGADGVHLRGHSMAPSRLRSIAPLGFLIAVSCHSAEEVRRADAEGASFAVLGPIFATPGKLPIGLRPLHEAAHSVAIPVLALGGVHARNAAECMRAGAAGIAGIGLYL